MKLPSLFEHQGQQVSRTEALIQEIVKVCQINASPHKVLSRNLGESMSTLASFSSEQLEVIFLISVGFIIGVL